MFCPQCGNESAEGQHYCRSCGTNLKVVGKAVTLSDVISKTDGVPAKVKEIVSNIKIANVSEEVSRAMDRMNREVAQTATTEARRARRWRREKTAAERRERHLTKGAVKFFTGGGLSIFLYFLFHAVELHLPPDVVANVPFAIDPVVRILWTIGLIPMLSGVGHVLAGLSIPKTTTPQIEAPQESAGGSPLRIDSPPATEGFTPPPAVITASPQSPNSVTERTTNILDRDREWRKSEAGRI